MKKIAAVLTLGVFIFSCVALIGPNLTYASSPSEAVEESEGEVDLWQGETFSEEGDLPEGEEAPAESNPGQGEEPSEGVDAESDWF